MKLGKTKMFRLMFFCAVLCIAFGVSVLAYGANEQYAAKEEFVNWKSLCAYGDRSNFETRITASDVSGVKTLVLPSTVRPDSVFVQVDLPSNSTAYIQGNMGQCKFENGFYVNLNKICANSDYLVKFTVTGSFGVSQCSVRFAFSRNIPAVYLKSEKINQEDRLWVESSYTKDNKAKGKMLMQKPDGSYVYSGSLTQIKGRGNTTWGLIKKPYQIKLDKKTDLLESDNKKNESKTWVLLANYIDNSSLRNTIALDIGKKIGMKMNVESRHVDLYYDGEYRGNYLLSEKVEVGKGRVNITDLDEENEKANPGVKLDKLPVYTGVSANGATYKYCAGMKSPADITGGYLLEMDFEDRAKEEICYFITTRGQYVVVKSPEYASKEEMDYISTLYQKYEDAVYAGGVNPSTGRPYSDYVDAESVASYFLVNELSKSRDCFKSSAYLYKDKGTGHLTMGPLWDYDMSFGRGGTDYNVFDSVNGIVNMKDGFPNALLKIESFYNLMQSVYINKMYPYIQNYLFAPAGSENYKHSYEVLSQNVKASVDCNKLMWHPADDVAGETKKIGEFINKRSKVLYDILKSYKSLVPFPTWEHRYIDVLTTDWYFNDITEASKLGYVRGIGNNSFEPKWNVTRAEFVQVLYNMSNTGSVSYKSKFNDVTQDHPYAAAITWATDKKLCSWGESDKHFKPDKQVTRGEVIKAMYNYGDLDCVGVQGCTGSYLDWYHVHADQVKALEWAITANLLPIRQEGHLNANSFINRGELCSVLVRYNGFKNRLKIK